MNSKLTLRRYKCVEMSANLNARTICAYVLIPTRTLRIDLVR